MELIKFILSSFWVWLGFVVLVGLILVQAVELVKAIRHPKRVEAYRVGQRWRVTIQGASKTEIETILKRAGLESVEIKVKEDTDHAGD